MRYVEYAPGSGLAGHVRCYWMLSGNLPLQPEPILPDGGWEIVFHLGAHFDEWTGGVPRRQADALLVADIVRPVTVAPSGAVDTVGVRFRPGGAYPFFRAPLRELSHRIHPLENLWSGSESVRQRLAETSRDRDRVAILDQFIGAAMVDSRVDTMFDRLIEQLRRHRNLRIASLSDLCGISDRQIERRFRDRVGVSPKTFQRILRFDELVRRISSDAAPWADAALDHGYYDQSHMILEFRQFSGMTPREFAHSVLPLNDSFH